MQRIFLDANICLDLLDSTRVNAKKTIEWYIKNLDNKEYSFYFSGDFITTFYYILSERKEIDKQKVVSAIKSLSKEIKPIFITKQDYLNAIDDFNNNKFNDFEDLIILNSALNNNCNIFVTNDANLLKLKKFNKVTIITSQYA